MKERAKMLNIAIRYLSVTGYPLLSCKNQTKIPQEKLTVNGILAALARDKMPITNRSVFSFKLE